MYEGLDADLYDLAHHGRGKDYAAESASIAQIVTERLPAASSLLDVACGTGRHLEHFARYFDDVVGVDISADMVRRARLRLPWLTVHVADMRSVELCRTFDAVTCLFSSIGHMADLCELTQACATLARHTRDGGIAVVEPWWFPETFLPGYVAGDVMQSAERTLARVSHSTRVGDTSRVEVHYLVADSASGVQHHVETTSITLFDRDQYTSAFVATGWRPEYLAGGPSGRGLFVATRNPRSSS